MYDYGYASDSMALMGVLSGMIMFMFIFCIIIYAVNAFLLMRIFDKAGREKWKAWVPFLNTWEMLEMCSLPGWLLFLAFVPVVNFAFLIVSCIMAYRLPICFEKTSVWGILCIFFPIIVYIILAFDSSEYCGYEK